MNHAVLGAFALTFGLACAAAAQPYPSKSIRLIVGSSAGGGGAGVLLRE